MHNHQPQETGRARIYLLSTVLFLMIACYFMALSEIQSAKRNEDPKQSATPIVWAEQTASLQRLSAVA